MAQLFACVHPALHVKAVIMAAGRAVAQQRHDTYEREKWKQKGRMKFGWARIAGGALLCGGRYHALHRTQRDVRALGELDPDGFTGRHGATGAHDAHHARSPGALASAVTLAP